MHRAALTSLVLAGCVGSIAPGAGPRPGPRECPITAVDTAAWTPVTDDAIGIELRYPPAYRLKRWESRSDTSGLQLAFWRDAANTIEFNEFQGFYKHLGPNLSIAPCRLRMRSGILDLHPERRPVMLLGGRNALFYSAKGVLAPPGRPEMLVELVAEDSTEFLKQVAVLRTIRFLRDR